MTITFGSLFSGIGGFDLGFERAGMTCAYQVENDPHARSVLQYHYPDVPKFGDITHVRSDELPPVDIICGGFPCQDVSVAGLRGGLAGERSGLWFEALRLIESHRPRWIVIENVPGLLSSNSGADFATILSGLVKCGYGVWGEVAREKWPSANIAGVDLNFPDKHPAYDTWKHADFLTLPTLSTEDLIMMNPPYGKKAYHFIKIGIDHLAPNGYLVALVLLGFLAAQSRAEFIFQTNKPEVVYVLPRRPSFRGAGGGSGTDTYNYMIGVWRKSNNSSDVALRMLDWNYDQRDKRKR